MFLHVHHDNLKFDCKKLMLVMSFLKKMKIRRIININFSLLQKQTYGGAGRGSSEQTNWGK